MGKLRIYIYIYIPPKSTGDQGGDGGFPSLGRNHTGNGRVDRPNYYRAFEPPCNAPAPAQEETAAQVQITGPEVAPQSQLQAKPGANAGQDGENVTTRQPEPAQDSRDTSMENLTDGTDSDEDFINANSSEPPIRKKKQIAKAAKKARAEAVANGGAAAKTNKGSRRKSRQGRHQQLKQARGVLHQV